MPLCSGEYNFASPFPVRNNWPVSAGHYMSAVLKPAVRVFELAPDAMQGEHFEVLLICFFFVLFPNQRYCSFKYCALHRIFCHKLVNIYIISIFRHILSYIQDNKMLLFSFVFFFCVCLLPREIPESECFAKFHKSKHCDSLFFCVCKINILNVSGNTAKPKQSAPKVAGNKSRLK